MSENTEGKFDGVVRRGRAISWFTSSDGALAVIGRTESTAPLSRTVERLFTPDGKLASGVWDSSAGVHEFQFDFDEIIFFLEGEVRVTAGGETQTFRAGDVAMVPAGTHMKWDVPQYVRKVWVHRYGPSSIVGGVARRLRSVAAAVLKRVPR